MSGLVTMTPTSIDHVGTSASINANGGVDFEGVTSLSLNGVFKSDYDNYLMVVNVQSVSAASTGVILKYRVSGADTTGSDYTSQLLAAYDKDVTAQRSTSSSQTAVINLGPTLPGGTHAHFYGPALSQPTAMRSIPVATTNPGGLDSARIFDRSSTHSLSTAYDGFTFSGSAMTGNVIVMGYAE